jgi:hypothetical protein
MFVSFRGRQLFFALNELYFYGLCDLPGSLTRLVDDWLPVSWPGQRGMYRHPNQIKSRNCTAQQQLSEVGPRYFQNRSPADNFNVLLFKALTLLNNLKALMNVM